MGALFWIGRDAGANARQRFTRFKHVHSRLRVHGHFLSRTVIRK